MDKNNLLEYLNRGKSIAEIAAAENLSKTEVRRLLVAYHLPTAHPQPTKRKLDAKHEKPFIEAVRTSISIAEIIRKLKLAVGESSYRLVKNEISRLGLDTSHLKGRSHGTAGAATRYLDNTEIFRENSTHTTSVAKHRIIRDRLISYECDKCKNAGEWMGEKLVLRLDHINGRRYDHRLNNLRFLCPNCDSQTDTYCGRNKHKYGTDNIWSQR